MFRIVRFSAESGRIRMEIETDSETTVSFLRLFADAERFAQAYAYRVRSETTAWRRARDPARLGADISDRIRRARYLAAYRSIPGSRRDRLRAVRELAIADGYPLSYDQTVSLVKWANQERRVDLARRAVQLAAEGRSDREIGRMLGMSPGAVARAKKIARNSPINDDLPDPRPLLLPVSR